MCVCVRACVRARRCVLKSDCPESNFYTLLGSITESVHLKSVNYFLQTLTVLHFLG